MYTIDEQFENNVKKSHKGRKNKEPKKRSKKKQAQTVIM